MSKSSMSFPFPLPLSSYFSPSAAPFVGFSNSVATKSFGSTSPSSFCHSSSCDSSSSTSSFPSSSGSTSHELSAALTGKSIHHLLLRDFQSSRPVSPSFSVNPNESFGLANSGIGSSGHEEAACAFHIDQSEVQGLDNLHAAAEWDFFQSPTTDHSSMLPSSFSSLSRSLSVMAASPPLQTVPTLTTNSSFSWQEEEGFENTTGRRISVTVLAENESDESQTNRSSKFPSASIDDCCYSMSPHGHQDGRRRCSETTNGTSALGIESSVQTGNDDWFQSACSSPSTLFGATSCLNVMDSRIEGIATLTSGVPTLSFQMHTTSLTMAGGTAVPQAQFCKDVVETAFQKGVHSGGSTSSLWSSTPHPPPPAFLYLSQVSRSSSDVVGSASCSSLAGTQGSCEKCGNLQCDIRFECQFCHPNSSNFVGFSPPMTFPPPGAGSSVMMMPFVFPSSGSVTPLGRLRTKEDELREFDPKTEEENDQGETENEETENEDKRSRKHKDKERNEDAIFMGKNEEQNLVEGVISKERSMMRGDWKKSVLGGEKSENIQVSAKIMSEAKDDGLLRIMTDGAILGQSSENPSEISMNFPQNHDGVFLRRNIGGVRGSEESFHYAEETSKTTSMNSSATRPVASLGTPTFFPSSAAPPPQENGDIRSHSSDFAKVKEESDKKGKEIGGQGVAVELLRRTSRKVRRPKKKKSSPASPSLSSSSSMFYEIGPMTALEGPSSSHSSVTGSRRSSHISSTSMSTALSSNASHSIRSGCTSSHHTDPNFSSRSSGKSSAYGGYCKKNQNHQNIEKEGCVGGTIDNTMENCSREGVFKAAITMPAEASFLNSRALHNYSSPKVMRMLTTNVTNDCLADVVLTNSQYSSKESATTTTEGRFDEKHEVKLNFPFSEMGATCFFSKTGDLGNLAASSAMHQGSPSAVSPLVAASLSSSSSPSVRRVRGSGSGEFKREQGKSQGSTHDCCSLNSEWVDNGNSKRLSPSGRGCGDGGGSGSGSGDDERRSDGCTSSSCRNGGDHSNMLMRNGASDWGRNVIGENEESRASGSGRSYDIGRGNSSHSLSVCVSDNNNNNNSRSRMSGDRKEACDFRHRLHEQEEEFPSLISSVDTSHFSSLCFCAWDSSVCASSFCSYSSSRISHRHETSSSPPQQQQQQLRPSPKPDETRGNSSSALFLPKEEERLISHPHLNRSLLLASSSSSSASSNSSRPSFQHSYRGSSKTSTWLPLSSSSPSSTHRHSYSSFPSFSTSAYTSQTHHHPYHSPHHPLRPYPHAPSHSTLHHPHQQRHYSQQIYHHKEVTSSAFSSFSHVNYLPSSNHLGDPPSFLPSSFSPSSASSPSQSSTSWGRVRGGGKGGGGGPEEEEKEEVGDGFFGKKGEEFWIPKSMVKKLPKVGANGKRKKGKCIRNDD